MAQREKVIFHIDVNSAFLSWEACYRKNVLGEAVDLREIPSAVAGDQEARRGVILAKSLPASQCGVKTGEAIWQAKEKCPALLLVKPNYALYAEYSQRFMQLLKEAAPVVEPYSIDEAYADMTGTEALYGAPLIAAEALKERIYHSLGFTVNIGVSCNKLLAKMAGELDKPDKVITLFPSEIADKLWPLPVRRLFYVGPASEQKLHAMGIYTIGQLAAADPAALRLRLHSQGEMIWHFAHGRSDDVVTGAALQNKEYSNSTTTPSNVTDRETAQRYLLSLSETVAMRLRRDHQAGRCVAVHLRTSSFYDWSQQAQLMQATDATLEIYRAACSILAKMWDGHTPLRLIGLAITHLEQESARQLRLFGDEYEKLCRADAAVDAIRARFGENAIQRACFLQGEIPAFKDGLAKERRSTGSGQRREDGKLSLAQEAADAEE